MPVEEARELALATAPVSREAAEHVLDYLLWNKAMIGESLAATERLDHYMTMVKDLREGVHIVIPDPYERATALLFELVLSEEFNPWGIDLVRFTQLYLERIQVAGMDFPVAGRLIAMAWNILLLQSQAVLSSRKDPEPAPADAPLDSADEGYLGEMSTPEELDVTETILTSATPPFEAMVRHSENRPVSLMELTRAFTEAERESRLALEAERARQKLRREQALASHEVLVHGEEVPAADLQMIWETALRHKEGERFPFTETIEGLNSRERIVSIFLSMLFLVRQGCIAIHQEKVGSGGVFLTRVGDEMGSSTLLIGSPIAPAATPAKA